MRGSPLEARRARHAGGPSLWGEVTSAAKLETGQTYIKSREPSQCWHCSKSGLIDVLPATLGSISTAEPLLRRTRWAQIWPNTREVAI